MKIAEFDNNNFTILRLVLALAVVLGHFKAFIGIVGPPWPFNYASAAVDCFFVVSGYLVTLSFDRDSSFQRFYLRRFFRIYPLYLVVVIVQMFVLASLADGGILGNVRSMMSYLALNAIFANFIQHDIGGVMRDLTDPSLNASLWTLKIEFGFYLLLPFIWLGVRRYGIALLVVIFALSAIYQETLRDYGQLQLAKQLPGQLQFFVLGVAAYKYRDYIKLRSDVALIAAGVLGLAMTMLIQLRTPVVYPLVVAAFVMITALRTPPVNLRNDISYGVYLLHAPIIQLSLLFGIYRPDWVGLTAIIAAVLVLAICAERWIEIPGIAMGRSLAKRAGPKTRRQAPSERDRVLVPETASTR